jgi:hypothetical protein
MADFILIFCVLPYVKISLNAKFGDKLFGIDRNFACQPCYLYGGHRFFTGQISRNSSFFMKFFKMKLINGYRYGMVQQIFNENKKKFQHFAQNFAKITEIILYDNLPKKRKN